MPKFLRARPPLDDSGARKIRRLAGARHAPADRSGRARIVALSWDGLACRRSRPGPAAMRTRCAAGCTGSTRPASTGSVTVPVPGASGGSPRRSGRGSSRWPGRSRPGGWTVTGSGSCRLTMSAARRSGPWTPSARRPGTPASGWGAARCGGSLWRRRCAGGRPAAGRPAPTRSSPPKDPHRGVLHRPAARLHGDLRRRVGPSDPAHLPARTRLVAGRAPDQGLHPQGRLLAELSGRLVDGSSTRSPRTVWLRSGSTCCRENRDAVAVLLAAPLLPDVLTTSLWSQVQSPAGAHTRHRSEPSPGADFDARSGRAQPGVDGCGAGLRVKAGDGDLQVRPLIGPLEMGDVRLDFL
jgi:hypothetical protein